MNENYYDILEINKNASQEIVEKAYKTLVKKYHPDLQEESLKPEYEEKIKKINEAYDILSDPEKRKNYDLTLKQNEVSTDEYNNLVNENINLENEINYLKNNQRNVNQENYNNSNTYNTNNNTNSNNNYNNNAYNNSQNNQNNFNEFYQQEVQDNLNKAYNQAYNKAYYDAYIQDLKNRGYKIKYKKSWKEIGKNFLTLLITIGVIALIITILWHIPFTRNYFINLYYDNLAFRFLINFFLSIPNIFKRFN